MKTSIFFFWLSFLSLLVSAQVDTSNLSPADRKYLQACLGNADFRELAPNYDNATINFSRRFHPWELSPTEIWNYKTLKFSVMPINDSVAVRKNSRYF
ncbi:MAG: hypothetical protein NTX66_02145, partial [Candidatus Falkowbacteria bacterium]|nr:hypothetical protein [Candidatus Falkowbacteria bacterium]